MNYLIFNDLSFPFKDKYEANAGLRNFVLTFSAAEGLGLNQLRLHKDIGQNLYSLQLAPGYSVSQWLNAGVDDADDKKANYSTDDLRNRFREIATSAPMITESELRETFELSKFEICLDKNGLLEAAGLGAAYLLDTITLSFLSRPFWDTEEIKDLKHYQITVGRDVSVFPAGVRLFLRSTLKPVTYVFIF